MISDNLNSIFRLQWAWIFNNRGSGPHQNFKGGPRVLVRSYPTITRSLAGDSPVELVMNACRLIEEENTIRQTTSSKVGFSSDPVPFSIRELTHLLPIFLWSITCHDIWNREIMKSRDYEIERSWNPGVLSLTSLHTARIADSRSRMSSSQSFLNQGRG